MPCSCGNASCPCGIPCYCLEKSCKCPECAIALHPICIICDKPLFADLLKDKGACSCFMGESTVLILKSKINQQYRMGNSPMPVGNFVNGRLIADAKTPALSFPQFLPQERISFRPFPSLMQTDFRTISPSFISDIDAVTPPSGIFSTAKLYELEKSSREPTCTGILTDAPNTDISCKETCPPLFFRTTDKKKIANVLQNVKSETEESVFVHEPSPLYLRSVGLGNISYPIGLTDPVWRLSNSAFCTADSPDSNLNHENTFHVAGPFHATQTMTAFERNCCQQASNFNFDSNDLVQKEIITVLERNNQPLDSTKIENPCLEGKSEEFKASLGSAAENELSGFLSLGDYKAISLIEPSNEILESCITLDKTLTAFSTEVSSSGGLDLSSVQRQPTCGVSTFSSENNDCLQNCSVSHNVTKADSFGEELFWKYLKVSEKQLPLEFFPSKSKKPNMRSSNSFEETTGPQNDNPSSNFPNNRGDEEIDSIPLYIDASTTRKMEKLLKSSKQ